MASTITVSKDEFRLLTWESHATSKVTICPTALRRHCPLDNDELRSSPLLKAKPFSLSSMGSFKTCPPEIAHLILNILDLQSLTNLRAVCWRARALVDSLPSYHSIVQYCPDTLRAMLSTHMPYISQLEIYSSPFAGKLVLTVVNLAHISICLLPIDIATSASENSKNHHACHRLWHARFIT
jgi:hypothetical protein